MSILFRALADLTDANIRQEVGNLDGSGLSSTYGHVSTWDVSRVTDMSWLFHGAVDFNQPIRSWNVSNVIFMRSMFDGAVRFNQPIDGWDVSGFVEEPLDLKKLSVQ